MTTLREAAQQAVTMLKTGMPEYNTDDVLEVLEAALAEPVQEPVAWYCKEGLKRGVSLKQETPEWIPLYTKEKP